MNVLSDLLGKRVRAEVKPGWSHVAHNGDDTTVVEGFVRAIGMDEAGFMLLIEDDGILHTRVSSLTKFKVMT